MVWRGMCRHGGVFPLFVCCFLNSEPGCWEGGAHQRLTEMSSHAENDQIVGFVALLVAAAFKGLSHRARTDIDLTTEMLSVLCDALETNETIESLALLRLLRDALSTPPHLSPSPNETAPRYSEIRLHCRVLPRVASAPPKQGHLLAVSCLFVACHRLLGGPINACAVRVCSVVPTVSSAWNSHEDEVFHALAHSGSITSTKVFCSLPSPFSCSRHNHTLF